MTATESVNSAGAEVVAFAVQSARPRAGGVRGRLASVAATLRYRFFTVAGTLPYALGCAAAYDSTGRVNWLTGALGLAAVLCVGLGIEGMNEYFDSRVGGDRVFASVRRCGARWHLPVGLAGLAVALGLGLCLAVMQGWGVLVFALCGGAVALSYLVPPIRLSHRGLGEAAIAVGYGPGLTMGGFYLQAGGLGWPVVLVSLVPGLAMFAMALVNEIPDYYGDRLVGKRNLIVRLGRRNGVILYAAVMALWFGVIAFGLLRGVLPLAIGLCILLIWPVWKSVRRVMKYREAPVRCGPVILTMILVFIAANVLGVAGYIIRRSV